MASKSFHFPVITWAFVLLAASVFTGFVIRNGNWFTALPLAIIAMISVYRIIHYVNSTNRKIAWFFDSVTNEDTTLHFPENVHPGSLRLLHNSLNRLNGHIAAINLKNEYNEKFFQEMLKTSANGLIAVNEDGYIEHINDAALELTGLEHIAHMDLLKQKNNDLACHMDAIKAGQSITVKVLHNNELRLFSLKMAILKFGTGYFKLFSIADIKAELEENELDSWQKLIRVMTHEIMNSIAPITSLSNTLSRIFIRDNGPLPAEEVTEKHISNIIEGLGVIENTGKGLMRFVEDYRKLTKIPAPVFRPFDIKGWLSSNLFLMKDCIEKNKIKVRTISEGEPETMVGDEKLLNQVLINLLNNAIDALSKTTDRKIIVRLSKNIAGRLKLSISDNGMGIPPEESDKVFVPFYTTKEEGSGIGLSLCRKIMRLHKGSISVYSAPGELTTFTLNF